MPIACLEIGVRALEENIGNNGGSHRTPGKEIRHNVFVFQVWIKCLIKFSCDGMLVAVPVRLPVRAFRRIRFYRSRDPCKMNLGKPRWYRPRREGSRCLMNGQDGKAYVRRLFHQEADCFFWSGVPLDNRFGQCAG